MDLAASVGRQAGRWRIAQFVHDLHAGQGAVLGQHGPQRAFDDLTTIVHRPGQIEDQTQPVLLRPANLEIDILTMPGPIEDNDFVSPLGYFRRQEEIPGKRAHGRKRYVPAPQQAAIGIVQDVHRQLLARLDRKAIAIRMSGGT